MAKNKTSKFDVSADLNYKPLETIKQSQQILDSIPKADAKKIGRPIERGDTYRFSLYLDADLKNFIKYKSWKNQQSITQYLNELVRENMNEYLESGGSVKEWKEKE